MRKWQKQGLKPRAFDYCHRALWTASFCLIWFSRPCGKELQLEHESGFSLVKIVIDWALPSVRITSFNSQNNSLRLQLLPPIPKWGNWGAESSGQCPRSRALTASLYSLSVLSVASVGVCWHFCSFWTPISRGRLSSREMAMCLSQLRLP